ncbi:MAG: GNAT family N-acetyltransferase [Dehalococcoidales bacterium]|nr:GNAT family N-acetyltransferase [Dehalococcoidales bacterium]
MSYSVIEDSLDNLNSYRADSTNTLDWPSVFVLPAWMKVWWQIFGSGNELYVRTVRQGEKIAGIAPLMVKRETALLIGDTDVCDYLDFVVTPGLEDDFFNMLLDDLKANGISDLDMKHVRHDSTVLANLATIAADRGYKVVNTQEDVSLEMDLPPDWDTYLESLSSKQRHEVRRKLRRLAEAGDVEHRFVEDATAVPATMDTFFKMFIESRKDKANFMTEQMESFFSLLAETMAGLGLLKLGVLKLDTQPVAEIMCFDYNNCIYLYNSGYDPEYTPLSAGLLSKVLAIKDSIENGKSRFDFLKGGEAYKYHLGGREIPLYRCQITIK